jgi:quercetin dioxygenase-like cupin family protein
MDGGDMAFDPADGDMMDDMDGDAEAMDDMLDPADAADDDGALDPPDSARASDPVRMAGTTAGEDRPSGSARRSAAAAAASLSAIRTTELLRTTTTVLGAPLLLPRESMVELEVRSAMVELDPGADTGWHEHTVPLYAHILDGALEVTYRTDAGDEVKLYGPGDTFMEAEGIVHRGRVAADGDGVRLIEVIMAAPGLEATIAVAD